MGLCASISLDEQISRQIDRDLKRSYAEDSFDTKILLLGAGGSGKSTVMRQFKMLYTSGFQHKERMVIKKEIHKNMVQGLQLLVQATRDHEVETANIAIANHTHIDTLFAWDPTTAEAHTTTATTATTATAATTSSSKEHSPTTNQTSIITTTPYSTTPTPTTTTSPTATTTTNDSALWSTEMTTACVELLKDPAIISAEDQSSKLQLEDSVRYFKHHIARIGAPDYIPSDTDIAHVRIRTKGVHPLRFQLGKANFLCVDVGGQRNERRKWISQFDNVDAVLFVASIAAFDMTLIEERTKNRASEAIELFEELSHSPYFRSTDIILFLNKKDLLQDKLDRGIKVAEFFPDYTGDNSYEDVVRYFTVMYQEAFANAQNVLLGSGLEKEILKKGSRSGLPARFSELEQKHNDRLRSETMKSEDLQTKKHNRFDSAGNRNTFGADSMWSSAPRTGGIGLNRMEQDSVRNKQLYLHVTHATDQQNVEFTFQSCQDIILRGNLSSVGLL